MSENRQTTGRCNNTIARGCIVLPPLVMVALLSLTGCASTHPSAGQASPRAASPESISESLHLSSSRLESTATIIAPAPEPSPAPLKEKFLKWDYSPDEVSKLAAFKVYSRPDAASGQWTLFATVPVHTVSFTLPFLPTNQSGFFIVTAVDKFGAESAPNIK